MLGAVLSSQVSGLAFCRQRDAESVSRETEGRGGADGGGVRLKWALGLVSIKTLQARGRCLEGGLVNEWAWPTEALFPPGDLLEKFPQSKGRRVPECPSCFL